MRETSRRVAGLFTNYLYLLRLTYSKSFLYLIFAYEIYLIVKKSTLMLRMVNSWNIWNNCNSCNSWNSCKPSSYGFLSYLSEPITFWNTT